MSIYDDVEQDARDDYAFNGDDSLPDVGDDRDEFFDDDSLACGCCSCCGCDCDDMCDDDEDRDMTGVWE